MDKSEGIRSVVLALIPGLPCTALAAQNGDESLHPPTRVLAAGKPIDVTTGHAAPYVLDFDGDGVRDLLVGEFGKGRFPVDQLPEGTPGGGKGYVHGRLRIYKNHGTNTAPRLKDFEYLRAGGGIASIPVT